MDASPLPDVPRRNHPGQAGRRCLSGRCRRFMSSSDNHLNKCLSCHGCSEDKKCATCESWPHAQWMKVRALRTKRCKKQARSSFLTSRPADVLFWGEPPQEWGSPDFIVDSRIVESPTFLGSPGLNSGLEDHRIPHVFGQDGGSGGPKWPPPPS